MLTYLWRSWEAHWHCRSTYEYLQFQESKSICRFCESVQEKKSTLDTFGFISCRLYSNSAPPPTYCYYFTPYLTWAGRGAINLCSVNQVSLQFVKKNRKVREKKRDLQRAWTVRRKHICGASEMASRSFSPRRPFKLAPLKNEKIAPPSDPSAAKFRVLSRFLLVCWIWS